MKQLLLLCLVVLFFSLSCKDEYRISDNSTLRISTSDYTIESGFTNKEDVKRFDEDKLYFWSDRSKIFNTQGFATDLVLDGEFIKYYESGQIFQKGDFKKGLKIGTWFIWDESGKVSQRAIWKNGELDGELVRYSYDTTTYANYRQGLRHGNQNIYVQDSLVLRQKYRNGKLLKSKEINLKKKKRHTSSDTLIVESNHISSDTLTSQKEAKHRLFNRKKNEEE